MPRDAHPRCRTGGWAWRNRFLDHWHHRQPEHDGGTLTWTLFAVTDPPFADCFRWRDGEAVHHDDARRILVAHDHPDTEYVRRDSVGAGWFH